MVLKEPPGLIVACERLALHGMGLPWARRVGHLAGQCIVLAVLAVAAAVFATLSLHRARQAEHLLARTSSLVPGQYLSTTNESFPIILRLAHLFLFWRPVAV